MRQGLHNEGETSVLEVYARGMDNSQPGSGEFSIRLANSLLLRVTDTSATNWDVSGNETVQGSTSSDTGTLYGAKDNGDGSVTLKLGDIGETEVFTIGETVSGQTSGASGTIDNAVFNISSISNSNFQPNEQIVDQTSGATADLKGVYGNVVEVNNLDGSFGQGNTLQGQESGASVTLDKQYAGVPGLFEEDTVSDIIDEAVNYTPPTFDADSTGWETKSSDLAGNAYMETKDISIEASGGDLGLFNLAILTVNIGGSGEIIVSSSPISGTPPSELIPSGGTVTIRYTLKMG